MAWVCLAAAAPLWAAEFNLNRTLKGVEDRYNSPRTMQLLFEQTYTWPGRPPHTERGELYLRKPDRMRWAYSRPAGKLFVSDGSYIYFYSPAAGRVEKTKVKESGDLRAPLAFLIGRLDFYRDFREFRTRPEGGATRILALPKSGKSPYTQVEFLVTSSNRIERLLVTGQDQSLMEFQFSDEKLNPPLDAALFEFQAPPGIQVIEVSGNGEGY